MNLGTGAEQQDPQPATVGVISAIAIGAVDQILRRRLELAVFGVNAIVKIEGGDIAIPQTEADSVSLAGAIRRQRCVERRPGCRIV